MSNDNVIVPFAKVTPKVTEKPTAPSNHLIVAMLEGFLDRAKAGEIQFCAVATVSEKGVAFSSWEPEESNPTLITSAMGAISYLDHRFGASAVNGEVDL